MNRILPFFSFILFLSLSGCGQKRNKETASLQLIIPEKPISWVSDFEKLFTTEQSNYLDSLIHIYETSTGNEIAIVTLSLDTFQIENSQKFDDFSLALFNKWGVGKKDKNNGIGILISTKLKRIRIEVGKGLIKKLSDEEAKLIIDTQILPAFKKGEYYNGVLQGLIAIFKEIE